MGNESHLLALDLRLSNERIRLASSKTARESAYRKISVAQIEKEIAGEKKFLNIPESINAIIDDDLLLEILQS